jgi:hypothetical protein
VGPHGVALVDPKLPAPSVLRRCVRPGRPPGPRGSPAGCEAEREPAVDGKKPNILVIMGDDIGWFSPSYYHQGMMQYQTPNSDRIAKEGALFTDWYGQNSCTAGRAAFVIGRSHSKADGEC